MVGIATELVEVVPVPAVVVPVPVLVPVVVPVVVPVAEPVAVAALVSSYISSRFPAPQYSYWLPGQVNEQSVAGARTEPVLIVLPQ